MSQWQLASPEGASSVRLKLIARAAWNNYVNASPSVSIFHSTSWLDLLEQVYRLAWQPLGVWEGSQLVGIFPLQTRRLGPFYLAGSPLMHVIGSTPHLGPVIEEGLLPSFLKALDVLIGEARVDHIEIALPWHLAEDEVVQSLGYKVETCQSVIVPLFGWSPVQLWNGLSSACRRAVRKAQASGVRVAEADGAAFIDEYVRMSHDVYRHSGRPPHLSGDFYTAAWKALAPTGQLKALLAMQGDKILAGALFLLNRGTCYYLSGASYQSSLPMRPNNLLQWHFMTWAAAQGYWTYDMGGAAVSGITRFKLSFGGSLFSYSRLYRANSLLATAGRQAYARLLPLWRRLQAM